MKWLLGILCCCCLTLAWANDNVVNVYSWADEIPPKIIQDFEKETGIKVNYSGYDSNEELFAKLKASHDQGYDVIEPSSYFVSRMRQQGMLQALDKRRLSHYGNVDPQFNNNPYDPNNRYSIPYFWGITGLYINRRYFPKLRVVKWSDLWQGKLRNQLLLLNDPREVFSMALLALGYSANDENPRHIKQAYHYLQRLLPNTKLYNDSSVVSIAADEDATIGMIWSGQFYNAHLENKQLQFVFPKEGFVIWVDTLAVPKNAPHLANAYKFIDFLLRARVARDMALSVDEGIANRAGWGLLPSAVRENSVIYPSREIMRRGVFQRNLSPKALALYQKYWQLLKLQ